MLRLNNESVRQELFVADVDTIMTVDVFVEEAFELADCKTGPVSHFG